MTVPPAVGVVVEIFFFAAGCVIALVVYFVRIWWQWRHGLWKKRRRA